MGRGGDRDRADGVRVIWVLRLMRPEPSGTGPALVGEAVAALVGEDEMIQELMPSRSAPCRSRLVSTRSSWLGVDRRTDDCAHVRREVALMIVRYEKGGL